MSIDIQPVLEGSLIELRPLRENDFNALFAVASDPLIWEQHPAGDRYQEPVFQKFFHVALQSGGALVVIDKRTGHIIGSSRYHGYDETRSEIEIGWTFLHRDYWGGVYNREMKYLMLKHAFQFVRNVVFLIGPNNYRSRKAVEKIGAVLIEPRVTERNRESVVYRITKSDFEHGRFSTLQ